VLNIVRSAFSYLFSNLPSVFALDRAEKSIKILLGSKPGFSSHEEMMDTLAEVLERGSPAPFNGRKRLF
jgi:hypothetical protein